MYNTPWSVFTILEEGLEGFNNQFGMCTINLCMMVHDGQIVLSEIHLLFPFHLILTSGLILIAKNDQRVVLS